MQQLETILCPDCESNYITPTRFETYGKCISCYRRETISKTRNTIYIPFKDLPQEEKQRLQTQRNRNNNWNRNKTKNKKQSILVMDTKKLNKTNRSYSKELHSFVQSLSNCTIKEMLALIQQKFPEYNYFTESILRSFLRRNNYIYKSTRENKNTNNTTNIINTPPIIKKNQIYTPDVIEAIKSTASELLTTSELRDIIKDMFPDKDITPTNFSNIISRYNIPHLKGVKGKKSKTNKKEETSDKLVLHKNEDEEEDLDLNNIIINKNNNDDYFKEFNNVDLTEEDKIRLKPICEEVDNVLQTKYKQLNCEFDFKYTTEDYLKALEIIYFLMVNKVKITQTGKKQHTIMDAYQRDIEHECENTLLKNGDTYFQDKLFVLRQKRRRVEYNGSDVSTMFEFLNSVNYNSIKKTIKELTTLQQNRLNPKFIPQVDDTMLDKYDWCEQGTKVIQSLDNIQNNDYVTEEVISNLNNTQKRSKNNVKLNTFRVQCTLSGAGYGTFKPWSKDYTCVSIDIAKSFAEAELKALKDKNKGLLISEISAHKINT